MHWNGSEWPALWTLTKQCSESSREFREFPLSLSLSPSISRFLKCRQSRRFPVPGSGFQFQVSRVLGLSGGATEYQHKAAALMHCIMLETSSNPTVVQEYCNQCIACLSDQGACLCSSLLWQGDSFRPSFCGHWIESEFCQELRAMNK